MLPLIIALMLPAAHAQHDVDHDSCFWFRRGDITMSDAQANLRAEGIRESVTKYCLITAQDLKTRAKYIAEGME